MSAREEPVECLQRPLLGRPAGSRSPGDRALTKAWGLWGIMRLARTTIQIPIVLAGHMDEAIRRDGSFASRAALVEHLVRSFLDHVEGRKPA